MIGDTRPAGGDALAGEPFARGGQADPDGVAAPGRCRSGRPGHAGRTPPGRRRPGRPRPGRREPGRPRPGGWPRRWRSPARWPRPRGRWRTAAPAGRRNTRGTRCAPPPGWTPPRAAGQLAQPPLRGLVARPAQVARIEEDHVHVPDQRRVEAVVQLPPDHVPDDPGPDPGVGQAAGRDRVQRRGQPRLGQHALRQLAGQPWLRARALVPPGRGGFNAVTGRRRRS